MARYPLAALLVIVVAAAWIWALPAAPIQQPIAFPHAKHAGLGIGCTACHVGAATGEHATIPDVPTCVRCHATPPPGTEAVWDRSVAAKTFGWVRLNRMPEHVRFSHQRHVTLGRLACESCHGEMKTRTTPPTGVARRLEMTTCLDCHRREGASEDCDACHR